MTTDAGATLTLHRAGHVLGSASVLIDIEGARVLFSGDLGRPNHPLLLPRAKPPAASTVVVESTYGDRTHPRPARKTTMCSPPRSGGRSRAAGRSWFRLRRRPHRARPAGHRPAAGEGTDPQVPVYVDSPMALAALDVYQRPDLAIEMRAEALQELVSMRDLHESRTAEESRRLNTPAGPASSSRPQAWPPVGEWSTTSRASSPAAGTRSC